jgi:ferrous iron transport protein A
MNLSQVCLNHLNRVKSVSVHRETSSLGRQLEDIGFLPGETVSLLRRGFMGGEPLLVRIGTSTFALRQAEARLVELEENPSL